MYGVDGAESVPHREWVLLFEKVLNEVKEDLKRQGREDEFIGARVCEILHLPCPLMDHRPLDHIHHTQIC